MSKYQNIPMTHLHCHSTYSELDCISKISDIVKRVKEYGQTSLAITDHGTISSQPEAYWECQKMGIKWIPACEFYFQPDANAAKEAKNRKNHHLILMAMDQEGWTNIKKLTTLANQKFYYAPRIDYKDLREHSNGLICMTACLKGVIPYAIAEEKYVEAAEHAKKMKDIFGDRFYFELQDGGLDIQIKVNEVMRRMAKKMDIRVVGAQDAHYVNRDDVEGHEGIWAIRTRNTFDDPVGYGPRDDLPEGTKQRPYYSTREFWLKDAHHMINEQLTTENGEKRDSTLRQAELEESAAIADRIGDVEIEKRMHLPKFEFIPDISQVGCSVAEECVQSHYHPGDIEDGETVDLTSFNYLCELVMRGYEKVYKRSWLDRTDEHRDRFAKELGDIKEAGLADYFLIVWDVVSWAKSMDIPVGPGRGCLTEKSYVLTCDGYKSVRDVKIGDVVLNANGESVNVTNTAKFDVNEDIIEISSYYDFFSKSQFTQDHKILVKRGDSPSIYGQTLHPSCKENKWLRADKIQIGDYVCIPKITNHHDVDIVFDLTQFMHSKTNIENGRIIEKTPINKPFDISMRNISKLSGISRNALKNLVDGEKVNSTSDTTKSKLLSALQKHHLASSVQEWVENTTNSRYVVSALPLNFSLDSDFATLVGLWIGDGWYHGNTSLSIALGDEDYDAISFIETFCTVHQIRFTRRDNVCGKRLVEFDIHSKLLRNVFYSLFGDVHSDTKFIPPVFWNHKGALKKLLLGLVWSDGCLKEKRVRFSTTSSTLMNHIRQLGYLLYTPSSVTKRVYQDESWRDSYTIQFARSSTIIELFDIPKQRHNFFFEDDSYMYCAVRKIETQPFNGLVYDLAVSGDSPSFLTGGYVVHNSAAGSMVSFCLGITEVDPLKYGLIWERFYNAGRKGSMPDIDVDVGKKFRPLVIQYITDRYGEDRVAQIVTFNTLSTKSALKDAAKIVGKKDGMSYEDANVMTRFIPLKHNQPVSIAKAIEQSERIAEYAEKYPRLFSVAQKIEGCPKSRGVHAAGVVISDEPFSEGFPLRWNTKEKKCMTEWDMEVLDSMGYLKMDILGLKTMDVLHDVEKDVNKEE